MFTISYFPYPLHFKRPAGTSRGYLRTKVSYFFRMAYKDQPNVVGWGECGPIKGLSVDDWPNLVAQLDRVCERINAGQPLETLDLSQWPSIAFGLEMARLDLEHGGKRLLFPSDFSQGRAGLPLHGLIWMDSHEGILRQVANKVDQSFTCIKMKIGALDFEQECAVLADIRQRFPEVQLRLDANGAYTPDDALRVLERLAHFDIHFLEQPIKPKQWSAMAKVCAESPIPIALDEELIGIHDNQQRKTLLETIQPQHIVLKPMLLGGFAAAEKWMELAEKLGIEWWINSSLESNVGLNAICQWTSALQTGRIHGLGTGMLYTNNVPSPIRLSGSRLHIDHSQAWDLSLIAILNG